MADDGQQETTLSQAAERPSDESRVSERLSSRSLSRGRSHDIGLDPEEFVGKTLEGRYKIVEMVGEGGMGVVYKAQHEFMERVVAIKMLLPTLLSDDLSIRRFQREAKAASRLDHPNVVRLHDFGIASEQNLPYLVMDFLDGKSLGDVIKSEGQLNVQRVAHIFSQICDALTHAHQNLVIHRDLKPGNIMLVTQNGDPNFVKVVDFGVAKLSSFAGEESQKLTQTGEVFGSPVYMSPEQCKGDELDARSDIYGLGIVLYESLTGNLPLIGKNVVETITKHLYATPPTLSEARPDLQFPPALEEVVARALAKEPGDRQQSMDQLKRELLVACSGGTLLSAANASGVSDSKRRDHDPLPETLNLPSGEMLKPPVTSTMNPLNSPAKSRAQAMASPNTATAKPVTTPVVVGFLVILLLSASAYAAYHFLSGTQKSATITPANHSGTTTSGTDVSKQPSTSQPDGAPSSTDVSPLRAQRQPTESEDTKTKTEQHATGKLEPKFDDSTKAAPPAVRDMATKATTEKSHPSPPPAPPIAQRIQQFRKHMREARAAGELPPLPPPPPLRPKRRFTSDQDAWDSFTERQGGYRQLPPDYGAGSQ